MSRARAIGNCSAFRERSKEEHIMTTVGSCFQDLAPPMGIVDAHVGNSSLRTSAGYTCLK